jgi:hypothetical protein
VKADVFRPQSVGRAVRTAFVLGVLVVIAIVAAVGAIVWCIIFRVRPSKDDLGRYLDDNAHSTIEPKNAGFTLEFPVPPTRQSERVDTDDGLVDAPRDGAVVDDEITFQVVWFDVAKAPASVSKLLSTTITRQFRQLNASRVAVGTVQRVSSAYGRDFVAVNVDHNGLKRYYIERVIVKGRRVWLLRVGSRIRRDAAFERFIGSFAFTG